MCADYPHLRRAGAGGVRAHVGMCEKMLIFAGWRDIGLRMEGRMEDREGFKQIVILSQ